MLDIILFPPQGNWEQSALDRYLELMLYNLNNYKGFRFNVTIIKTGKMENATIDILKSKYPFIKHIINRPHNISLYASLNTATDLITQEYCIFMQYGIEVYKNWEDSIISYLSTYNVVTPKIVTTYGSLINAGLLTMDEYKFRGNGDAESAILYSDDVKVNAVALDMLCINTQYGKKVNWFNDQFFNFFGDLEFSHRCRLKNVSMGYIPTTFYTPFNVYRSDIINLKIYDRDKSRFLIITNKNREEKVVINTIKDSVYSDKEVKREPNLVEG